MTQDLGNNFVNGLAGGLQELEEKIKEARQEQEH
jgi:hypothetical protein